MNRSRLVCFLLNAGITIEVFVLMCSTPVLTSCYQLSAARGSHDSSSEPCDGLPLLYRISLSFALGLSLLSTAVALKISSPGPQLLSLVCVEALAWSLLLAGCSNGLLTDAPLQLSGCLFGFLRLGGLFLMKSALPDLKQLPQYSIHSGYSSPDHSSPVKLL